MAKNCSDIMRDNKILNFTFEILDCDSGCNVFKRKTVCASNGITFRNPCLMQKYACSRGITLTVQSQGPCQESFKRHGGGSRSSESGSDSSEEDKTPVKPSTELPTKQPCK